MPGTSAKALLTVACFAFASWGSAAAAVAEVPPAHAAPSATADPAATPAPVSALKEIGHVQARTTFCQAVYDHGSHATAAALDNDATIAATSVYLNHAELDENAMAKPKAVYDMQRSYEALMARAHDAIDEFKTLRKLADDAPTPEQKAALIAYADAVGGALHRQEIVAKDYREFAVYIEAHDPVAWQDRNRALMWAAITQPRPEEMATDPRDRVTPYLADLAKAEATHLTEIHQKVIGDEVRAAASVDAAFGPCAAQASP